MAVLTVLCAVLIVVALRRTFMVVIVVVIHLCHAKLHFTTLWLAFGILKYKYACIAFTLLPLRHTADRLSCGSWRYGWPNSMACCRRWRWIVALTAVKVQNCSTNICEYYMLTKTKKKEQNIVFFKNNKKNIIVFYKNKQRNVNGNTLA